MFLFFMVSSPSCFGKGRKEQYCCLETACVPGLVGGVVFLMWLLRPCGHTKRPGLNPTFAAHLSLSGDLSLPAVHAVLSTHIHWSLKIGDGIS